ncbi:MAG TPA: carboxymuconolactone decarboxylase family protein [Acidimicrobiales bacterium]|nr:carboxymuconolactone decarboxylase family protein [Acidimicrobiales bacterium]
MAYVTMVERPKGIIRRGAAIYARRRFGRPVEPAMAASHHNGVLVSMGVMETSVELGWRKLDQGLRYLAIQLTSTRIGCSWCVDYGYYETVNHGMDPEKIRSVGQWRESTLYDERERAVLEYAELATATPVSVPAAVVERLREFLSEAEVVELASWVALENFRSRFNGGLGLKSQGFAESCQVPLTPAAAQALASER